MDDKWQPCVTGVRIGQKMLFLNSASVLFIQNNQLLYRIAVRRKAEGGQRKPLQKSRTKKKDQRSRFVMFKYWVSEVQLWVG